MIARLSSAIEANAVDLEIPQRERLAHRPLLECLFDSWTDRDDRNQRVREAHGRHRYSIAEIARYLGLGRSTICRAVRQPRPPAVAEK